MSTVTADTIAVWFELPAKDLARAQTFYETVLGRPMRPESTPCMDMVIFGSPDSAGNGALVKSEQFVPSAEGVTVYLSAGDDLAVALGRVEAAGGRVLMPKTSIAPHGFIALFIDSEGNRVGLHSLN